MKPLETREILSQSTYAVATKENYDLAIRGLLLNGFRGNHADIFYHLLRLGFELTSTLSCYGCLNPQAVLIACGKNKVATLEIQAIVNDAQTVINRADVCSQPLSFSPEDLAMVDQFSAILAKNFGLKLQDQPLGALAVRILSRTATCSFALHLATVVFKAALEVGANQKINLSFSPTPSRFVDSDTGAISGRYSGLCLKNGELRQSSDFKHLTRKISQALKLPH